MLKDGSGRSTTGLYQNRARAALVVSEVSLAIILLVGSVLLMRSFHILSTVDRGFDATNVLSFRMPLTGPKYTTSSAVADTIRIGLDELRTMPGVIGAGATCCLPLEDGTYDESFNIVGRPREDNREVGFLTVSQGFFGVFKIPLKRGRTFSERDDVRSTAVVVINETMARQYWKDRDPLGDRILIGLGHFNEPVREIIGIVGDVRADQLNLAPRPILYVPQAQLTDAANAFFGSLSPMAWVMRTQSDPHTMLRSVRERLERATGWPVSEGRLMNDVVSTSIARQRFDMLLMTLFGCAALLLAATGIYGLISYTVEQRTQEIGIRLALGAGHSNVRNMVVSDGMRLTLIGLASGLAAVWGLARFLESLLFGLRSRDPVVFLSAALVLGAVAFVACWLPATRASKIDPAETLRRS